MMANSVEPHPSERSALRVAAWLLLVGFVVSVLAGLLHPEGADPNDHRATFAIYANSRIWTAVHLGQFVGMAMLVFGLVALFFALGARHGVTLWLARIGLVSSIVALALYGVLQAVDGVALKQAVDAWTSASGGEKVLRFASAESVRWLEWAVRSYQSFVFGYALIMFGVTIAITRRVAPAIGYVMALSGLAYLVQGWIIGASGFSPANAVPTLAGIILVAAWVIWLLVAALRPKSPPPPARESTAI